MKFQPNGNPTLTPTKPGVFTPESVKATEPPKRHLAEALVSGAELGAMVIPPREMILGDFFKAGDPGIIFAPRGVGKSWMAMGMAEAIASGGSFGPWQARKPQKVLYVDGEMFLDDTQARHRMLGGTDGANITFLHHQLIFDRTERSLNLADPAQQRELTEMLVAGGHQVLFLDNLSCLFRGVRENDADDWGDAVDPWFLELRRRKKSVVLVAHAGRNTENVRGTSKREDGTLWVMRLKDTKEDDDEGARFIVDFTKCRNAPKEPPPLEWIITPDGRGGVDVQTMPADNLTLFRSEVESGVTHCGDIAANMGLTSPTVSKLAKKAMKQGWLEIKGREYKLREAA